MNDVERDLRERFARTEARLTGPDFGPPTAPAWVLRRTRRRQMSVAVVGLLAAVAIAAASIAGATALIRSSERRVPAEPPTTYGALEAVEAQPISLDELVADTEGRLWSTWPVLTSYDPASGTVRSFTRADDPALAGAGPAAPAREGGVWLIVFGRGGELAVARFNGDRFVQTSVPAPTDHLGAIVEAPDGTVWVGGNGVFSWDGESWSEAPTTGRLSREAGDITVDTSGNVWVKDIRFPGPEWLGISRLDGSAWTSYPLDEVLPSDQLGVPKDNPDRGSLWTTVAGADGDVWVGGCGGISHFVGGSWTSYPSLPLGLNNVMSIAVADDGAVWIGSEAIGGPVIARFDGTSWAPVTDGLVDNGEEYQYTDVLAAGGQVWAVVNGALLRWDGEAFVPVLEVDRPQELMSPFLAAGPDELWTGDWGAGGAWRLLGDTWTHFDDRAELPGELQGLALGPEGTLWATSTQGAWRFDGSRWGLAESGDFHAIAFGPDGGVWVAGKHTVQRVGGSALPGKVPFISDTTSLVVLADDDVWAASRGGWMPGGLAHFDGERWTDVEPIEGNAYAADWISGLEVTPDGDVWVSLANVDTERPNQPDPVVVARFDGSSWRTYNDADGVPFGMTNDGFGRLEIAPDGTPVLSAAPGLVEFRDGAWTLLQEGRFGDFSIAPDGTIWISSDGLYRLPAP